MAKVQQTARKVQDCRHGDGTANRVAFAGWLLCSPVWSLPSWRSESGGRFAQRTRYALPMRGGMRSKRKSMLGHCVFTVRLLSLRAAGRTQRRTSCGHASPWRMHRQCFARTCDLRPAASSKSSKDCAPPNDNSENARSMGVQLSVISLYLC